MSNPSFSNPVKSVRAVWRTTLYSAVGVVQELEQDIPLSVIDERHTGQGLLQLLLQLLFVTQMLHQADNGFIYSTQLVDDEIIEVIVIFLRIQK